MEWLPNKTMKSFIFATEQKILSCFKTSYRFSDDNSPQSFITCSDAHEISEG